MKLGCSSWSFRKLFDEGGMDLPAFMETAKEMGFDAVELLHPHFKETSPTYLSTLVKKAEELELEISAVSPGNDFALPDAEARENQVQDINHWARVAAGMGVKNVRVFTGSTKQKLDYDKQKQWVLHCFKECCGQAEQLGTFLAIENHSTVMRAADEIVWLLSEVGSDHLKTNPDPTNFSGTIWTGLVPNKPGEIGAEAIKQECEIIYEENKKVAPHAVHAHLKVGLFDAGGNFARVDYARLVDTFREANYDGVLSLELIGPTRQPDPFESLPRCVELLRPML